MEGAPASYSQPPPDDEVDVCRVCRCGEEEGELYWPCQCSGSMRVSLQITLSRATAALRKSDLTSPTVCSRDLPQ
jgi:hypothetical protein